MKHSVSLLSLSSAPLPLFLTLPSPHCVFPAGFLPGSLDYSWRCSAVVTAQPISSWTVRRSLARSLSPSQLFTASAEGDSAAKSSRVLSLREECLDLWCRVSEVDPADQFTAQSQFKSIYLPVLHSATETSLTPASASLLVH